MKFQLQIFISVALLISQSNCCQTCEANLNQDQCLNAKQCTWGNSKCTTITECSQLNATTCQKGYLGKTCALVNNVCAPAKCESLTPQSFLDCYANNCEYNFTTSACQNVSSTMTTKPTNYDTCYNTTEPKYCSYFSNITTKTLCYNNNGTNCANTTITDNCTQYEQDACSQLYYCIYNQNKCIARTCASIDNNSNEVCGDFYDNQGNIQHCEKVNGTCTNLALSSLNQTQCDLTTSYTTWTGTQCQVCSDDTTANSIKSVLGISTNSKIVDVIFILFISLFIVILH